MKLKPLKEFWKKNQQDMLSGLLIICLVAVGILLCLNYHIRLEQYSGFLAAMAAFLGVIFGAPGILSWRKKQEAQIAEINIKTQERLAEKKLDLAAEITEAFHKVNQSLQRICNRGTSYEEETKSTKDLKEIENDPDYPHENPLVIKKGLVFLYRWNKELDNLNNLLALKIKARIYFGEELEKCFEDTSLFFHREIWVNITMLLEGTAQLENEKKSFSRKLWDMYGKPTPMDEIIKKVEQILIPLVRPNPS